MTAEESGVKSDPAVLSLFAAGGQATISEGQTLGILHFKHKTTDETLNLFLRLSG